MSVQEDGTRGELQLNDIISLGSEEEQVAACQAFVTDHKNKIRNQTSLINQLQAENQARTVEIRRVHQDIAEEREQHEIEVELLQEEGTLAQAGTAHVVAEAEERLAQLSLAQDTFQDAAGSAESLREKNTALDKARLAEAERHARVAHRHREEVARSKRVLEARFLEKLDGVDRVLKATAFSALPPKAQVNIFF